MIKQNGNEMFLCVSAVLNCGKTKIHAIEGMKVIFGEHLKGRAIDRRTHHQQGAGCDGKGMIWMVCRKDDSDMFFCGQPFNPVQNS